MYLAIHFVNLVTSFINKNFCTFFTTKTIVIPSLLIDENSLHSLTLFGCIGPNLDAIQSPNQPSLILCFYQEDFTITNGYHWKNIGTVEDDISAVSIAPFSLPSSPSLSEDEESSMSSTSCLSPSSPIGGS